MNVKDVLERKGNQKVETIGATEPLRSAIERFSDVKVRCFVVTEGAETVGVITMRDILRLIKNDEPNALGATVRDAMTAYIVTVTPQTSLDETQTLIASRQINHVPVLDAGKLVGIVSLADLLKGHLEDKAELNRDLLQYINGSYAI